MKEIEYFEEGKCCIKKCYNEVFQKHENLCFQHWKPWFNWKVEYTERNKKPLKEIKNEKDSNV